MLTATPTTKTKPKPLQPMVPDFCIACDAVDGPYPVVMRPTEQEYRGETITVLAPAHECPHCGFRTLGPGHLTALVSATSDAYRQKHGLLTSAEIIQRRKAMKKSQRQFADFVGVSVASLKRWETGFLVQDKASDVLVRMKTDHVTFTEEIPLTMTPQVETLLETCMNGAKKQAGNLLAGAAKAVANFLATSGNNQTYASSNELALAA
jgi:putative zinc finger/helix-turn-helix YgiT family protein